MVGHCNKGSHTVLEIGKIRGLDPEITDLIKLDLEKKIYWYGDNFLNHIELNDWVRNLLIETKNEMRNFLSYFRSDIIYGDADIICDTYFGLDKDLRELGFRALGSPWSLGISNLKWGSRSLRSNFYRLLRHLSKSPFNEIMCHDFYEQIRALQKLVRKELAENRPKALFISNDMGFCQRLMISCFQREGIPTFVALHGLPARYNGVDDNRADWLIVWGEAIRGEYVKSGVSPNKITVSGHPRYSKWIENFELGKIQSSLEHVLVLTKSLDGAQHSDRTKKGDRGDLVLYLTMIQRALEVNGVKRATIRCHPSENPEWYGKYIDRGFWGISRRALGEDLKSATLVIGPSSTVFLEALIYGVNYYVFEPVLNNTYFYDYKTFPPFDGSDLRVPVAKTLEDLQRLIASGGLVDPEIITSYIAQRFDMSEVLKKLSSPGV